MTIKQGVFGTICSPPLLDWAGLCCSNTLASDNFILQAGSTHSLFFSKKDYHSKRGKIKSEMDIIFTLS